MEAEMNSIQEKRQESEDEEEEEGPVIKINRRRFICRAAPAHSGPSTSSNTMQAHSTASTGMAFSETDATAVSMLVGENDIIGEPIASETSETIEHDEVVLQDLLSESINKHHGPFFGNASKTILDLPRPNEPLATEADSQEQLIIGLTENFQAIMGGVINVKPPHNIDTVTNQPSEDLEFNSIHKLSLDNAIKDLIYTVSVENAGDQLSTLSQLTEDLMPQTVAKTLNPVVVGVTDDGQHILSGLSEATAYYYQPTLLPIICNTSTDGEQILGGISDITEIDHICDQSLTMFVPINSGSLLRSDSF